MSLTTILRHRQRVIVAAINVRIFKQLLELNSSTTHLQQYHLQAAKSYVAAATTATTIVKQKLLFNLPEIAAQIKRTMAATATKYKLNEVEGDLFSAPDTHSLAHCVGADFAMGAGIAVKFKQIYGQVSELRTQGVQSGGVAVLKDKERFVYYLVTKPQSYGSPTYDSLRSSLTAMREHMRKNNVTKLAIPRIGCGIDGLEWDKVSAELNTVFAAEDLEIVVYNFVPK